MNPKDKGAVDKLTNLDDSIQQAFGMFEYPSSEHIDTSNRQSYSKYGSRGYPGDLEARRIHAADADMAINALVSINFLSQPSTLVTRVSSSVESSIEDVTATVEADDGTETETTHKAKRTSPAANQSVGNQGMGTTLRPVFKGYGYEFVL
jgi:hypothetical protein